MIFGAVIIAAIMFNQWVFLAVFSLIGAYALREFYGLVFKGENTLQTILGVFVGFCLFVYSFLYHLFPEHRAYGFLLLPFVLCLIIVELYQKSETPLDNISKTLMGLIYIALPFSLMNFVVFYSGSFDGKILLGVFMLMWTYDSGAYFVGVSIGKHRLFERISPKKSWEGLVGGAIGVLLMSLLGDNYLGLTQTNWIVIGLLVVVFGTFGDLVESMIKRSLLIKDSGSIIPGHGGLLDRFDSIVFTIAPVVCYLYLIN